jgi:hypothetical protein
MEQVAVTSMPHNAAKVVQKKQLLLSWSVVRFTMKLPRWKPERSHG